jgi:hypothetical protein
MDILKTVDLDRIKVTCFTIENYYGEPNIEVLMNQNNYLKVYRLGDDDIYLHKSKYRIGFRIRRRAFLYRSKLKKIASSHRLSFLGRLFSAKKVES